MTQVELKALPKTSISGLSHGLINQIRTEKARMSEQSGIYWSYDSFLKALLLHWQAAPPRKLPTRDELRDNTPAVAHE